MIYSVFCGKGSFDLSSANVRAECEGGTPRTVVRPNGTEEVVVDGGDCRSTELHLASCCTGKQGVRLPKNALPCYGVQPRAGEILFRLPPGVTPEY